jgi:hypothetical protein
LASNALDNPIRLLCSLLLGWDHVSKPLVAPDIVVAAALLIYKNASSLVFLVVIVLLFVVISVVLFGVISVVLFLFFQLLWLLYLPPWL